MPHLFMHHPEPGSTRTAEQLTSCQHNCDDQKCINPDYAAAAPPAGNYPLTGL